ncbi:MAG: hypothetical protein M1546_14275 [Chloroflexi bacterium]|nr:hypothetical protein [Chloroflexota bacterium]
MRGDRMVSLLKRALDPAEFLSDYGIRALSKHHDVNPFVIATGGMTHAVRYVPAESRTGLFDGNSNWRGPVWFPLNYLLIEWMINRRCTASPPFVATQGRARVARDCSRSMTMTLRPPSCSSTTRECFPRPAGSVAGRADRPDRKARRDLQDVPAAVCGRVVGMVRKCNPARLVVVFSADDLRAEGLSISRRLLWQRTAKDFVCQMACNPLLEWLANCDNVIVRFDL